MTKRKLLGYKLKMNMQARGLNSVVMSKLLNVTSVTVRAWMASEYVPLPYRIRDIIEYFDVIPLLNGMMIQEEYRLVTQDFIEALLETKEKA